jgi:hypothetical protein
MPAGLDPEIGEEKYDFYESMCRSPYDKEENHEKQSVISTELVGPVLFLPMELGSASFPPDALDKISPSDYRSEESRSTW